MSQSEKGGRGGDERDNPHRRGKEKKVTAVLPIQPALYYNRQSLEAIIAACNMFPLVNAVPANIGITPKH